MKTYNAVLNQLHNRSLNALIDGDDAKCVRLAGLMEKTLQCALGNECPHCAGKNVVSNDEEAECSDCGETFDIGGEGCIP